MTIKERVVALVDLLQEPGASPADHVRCSTALFATHAGMFALKDLEGDPEEKRKAVLEVAFELVTRAHGQESAQ